MLGPVALSLLCAAVWALEPPSMDDVRIEGGGELADVLNSLRDATRLNEKLALGMAAAEVSAVRNAVSQCLRRRMPGRCTLRGVRTNSRYNGLRFGKRHTVRYSGARFGKRSAQPLQPQLSRPSRAAERFTGVRFGKRGRHYGVRFG